MLTLHFTDEIAMELEGLEVVKYLSGYNTVRDGILVSLSFHNLGTGPVVELTFETSRRSGTRTVKLVLEDIEEFDYSYAAQNPPDVIEFVKCLMTEQGEFYLSLDPFDERETFISKKDNEFFRSRSVKLIVHDGK
jgi:hypothetical protein